MDAVAQSFEPFGGDLLPATAKETERPTLVILEQGGDSAIVSQ